VQEKEGQREEGGSRTRDTRARGGGGNIGVTNISEDPSTWSPGNQKRGLKRKREGTRIGGAKGYKKRGKKQCLKRGMGQEGLSGQSSERGRKKIGMAKDGGSIEGVKKIGQ